MARDFNGTNESISLGTDASVDGFTTISGAFWLQKDVLDATYFLTGKDRATIGWALLVGNTAGGNDLEFNRDWTGTDGVWSSGVVVGTGLVHVAFTYDGGATTNDPALYHDAVAATVTEASTPTTALGSDAAQALLIGTSGTGGSDLNGAIQNYTYANAVWSAAQVNRHKWWGRVGGAVAVHHPFLTTKTANEGTATAAATPTGTTMRSLPRTMRPGCGGW